MGNVPKYLNIAGNSNLVRDTFSMGIVNVDQSGYIKAQEKHKLAMKKLEEDRRKAKELNTLRTEVDELKKLVQQLVEKKN